MIDWEPPSRGFFLRTPGLLYLRAEIHARELWLNEALRKHQHIPTSLGNMFKLMIELSEEDFVAIRRYGAAEVAPAKQAVLDAAMALPEQGRANNVAPADSDSNASASPQKPTSSTSTTNEGQPLDTIPSTHDSPATDNLHAEAVRQSKQCYVREFVVRTFTGRRAIVSIGLKTTIASFQGHGCREDSQVGSLHAPEMARERAVEG